MTPEQITGQLTEAQPALSWRTAMDKIVEAIKADIRTHFASDIQADIVARAALVVAAPMVLEMAAEAMESLCFFTDVSELIGMTKQEMSERTCHEGARAIRNLKETFNGNG